MKQGTLLKNINKINSKELTEVKKGNTGTGLLIENDGHIFTDSDIIQQINEDIKSHKEFVIPDHFIVSAVFQKYGIKNANGRIYPENILKREVDKYIKEKVMAHNAIGALDHPSCVDKNTKILTENGWKNIVEVEVGENILTLNKDREIEIHPIIRKINEPYNGIMYHIYGNLIDILVTPEHKFPIYDINKNFKGFYTAEEIYSNNIPDIKNSYLYKNGEWISDSDKEFIISKLSDRELSKIKYDELKYNYNNDVIIPMDIWAKFLGIYISSGKTSKNKVSIYHKNQKECDIIEHILNELPFEYTISEQKNKNKIFTISDKRLSKYTKKFGNYYERFVPVSIKKQGKDILHIFYDWFIFGLEKKINNNVFSPSQQLIMDINEIQFKIGYNGLYYEDYKHNDKNLGKIFYSNCSLLSTISLDKNFIKIDKVDFNDRVYCVEVENHTFYAMGYNGKCVWSGNSSTLSGHDVTHRILNLEWKGKTLIGDMELHLSPGYRKYGICSTSGDLAANLLIDNILIGVSSRAVGSVEDKFGVLMVGDDLELIGWDIVMEPSTPSAYIKLKRSELSNFIESDETKEMSNPINEKIEKINKILL